MTDERVNEMLESPEVREVVKAYLSLPEERRPEALELITSVLDHTIGELCLNDNERLQLYDTELTCGDCLQILEPSNNPATWIDTRVEHSEERGYYLIGINKDPVGLFARLPQ